MRAYADSSFIIRMITGEANSPQTIAEYRRQGSPRMFFLSLHALEVRSAVLQRAFHQRRSASSEERRNITRERDAALARLDALIARQALLEVSVELEAVMLRATSLAISHTERTGARALDLLHVAAALTLESELFLTTDIRQAALAKAEGLKVVQPN